jgi:hypothetical protein
VDGKVVLFLGLGVFFCVTRHYECKQRHKYTHNFFGLTLIVLIRWKLTERECIVKDFNPDAKHVLLTRVIEIRNRYIKLVDVEKQVTNVTINDAPCELSDIAICGYISKFGEVVQDSLRRGTMKGTNIQTGTRYLQLTNCIPIIPNTTKFGRLTIRIFTDNNRAQCIYCSFPSPPVFLLESRVRNLRKFHGRT